MVDGSAPWKDELVKVAARLEARTKQRRWAPTTEFLIERDVVVGAYALRTVIAVASDSLTSTRVPVRVFDPNDLDNGRRTTLSVGELCDEILHGGVVDFCCGETTDLFDGIYLSSDRNGNEPVHLLLASDFIALCDDVGMGLAQRS